MRIFIKKVLKKSSLRKKQTHIFEKLKKLARNQIIMVGKLNYMENDAELDGQWSNLMDKDRF